MTRSRPSPVAFARLKNLIFTLIHNPDFVKVWTCATAVDVGCGPFGAAATLGIPYVGIEPCETFAQQAERTALHVVRGNFLALSRPPNTALYIATDVIEHMTKEDGWKMMERMESAATKMVVITTPNGFLHQPPAPENPWQEHKSGWTVADFRARGYEVYVRLGPKSWHGMYHIINRRPAWFWSGLSLVLNFVWYRSHPQNAAGLCAIKRL